MKSIHTTNKTRRPISQKSIAPFSNLPIPLSSFIGRKHEIERVRQLVLAHRLVTLTGAGGSGKTRLALESVQELAEEFNHGVWFVDLASLGDASLIPDKIASTLNVNKHSKETSLDSLTAFLSKRKMLLILDNCEHIVAACAKITESLLQKSLQLHILTTSRELLGIPSEVTWVVPPLKLPDLGSSRKPANQGIILKQVQASESVQLFIERAASKIPDFTLTVDNCKSVAEICNRLDGMPLAIELAAAQLRSLSVQEVAQRLDQRFQFLTGGSRNAPSRQRTLLAVMDWSYALLTTKEQTLLRRLSIFAGGASLESAETICIGEKIEEIDVLDTLSHLVDKSLVTANRFEGSETRYRLLETIREYELEKLAESQEKTDVRNKHLD
jgi:predicted ATPase